MRNVAIKLSRLLFGVVVLLFLNSAYATDNFVKINLPKGVSVEVPKNWVVISQDQLIPLDAMVESGLDLAGIDQESYDLPFGANYYKNGKSIGVISNRYYPDFDLTQYDAEQVTNLEVKEFDAALKENIIESLSAFEISTLSWEGTKKITINGITTFVTEYHQKSLKDAEVFRVRLVRVFAGKRSFILTVSYNENEAFFLEKITDRVISSLQLTGFEKESSDFSLQTSVHTTSTKKINTENSGLQLFVQPLNLVSSLVFFYCLFSIPAQITRRFRLKKQGKAVSPMLLIIRKLLKYWFFTALIFIPFSLIISYLALSEEGLSGADIYVALITKVFIGNIGTTLFFGYVLMKAKKESWSYSTREDKRLEFLEAEAAA